MVNLGPQDEPLFDGQLPTPPTQPMTLQEVSDRIDDRAMPRGTVSEFLGHGRYSHAGDLIRRMTK